MRLSIDRLVMSSSHKLRLGVIGAGAFAEACHVPGLLSHPRAEVVMICGRERTRTQSLAARFGIPSITIDPAELCACEQLDAVTICTPNDAHSGHALLALNHGKHVFCEKPLSLTVREAAEMASVARASGLVHQVGFTYRHLFGVQELQRRVKQGEVGQPFLLRARHEYCDGLEGGVEVGWRHRQEIAGGGVLHDSGAHLFDLARLILGPITAIRAELQFLGRPGVETDDVASIGFRCASGAHGQWFATRLTPAHRPNFVQVVGSEGALEALISRGGLDALSRGGRSGWEDLPLPDEARDGRPHALDRMMRSFVDACLQGRLGEEAASFDDGLAVQQLIATAEEAASLTGWVQLEPPS
jgi:predicted dehydrogenase